MRRLAAALTVVAAGPAQAHSFQSGADLYAQFTEGTGVPIADPRLAVALIACGLAISLRDAQGMPRAWPWLFGGLLAGLLVAPWVGPWIFAVTLGLGVLVAVIAAIVPRHAPAGPATLAIALAVAAASLEGHRLGEVPAMLQVGVGFGLNLGIVLPAAIASLALTRLAFPATAILLRVAASWCGAIAVMLLAFELR